MDNTIIIATPAQLQTIISEAVNAILPKLADFRRKNEPVETDGMNVDDAARFLSEQGIPTTRATLYGLSSKNPFLTINSDAAWCFRNGISLPGSNPEPSTARIVARLLRCVLPKVPTVNKKPEV